MIREHSLLRIAWDAMIAVLAIVSCIVVTWQVAFSDGDLSLAWSAIYIIDVFFVIDIGLNFFTSYREGGVEVVATEKTSGRYARTMLPIDVVANLPWELLVFVLGEHAIMGVSLVLWLRLPRVLRIVRFFRIVDRWDALPIINPGMLRIVNVGIGVALATHIVACAWFLTAAVDAFPPGNWAETAGIVGAQPVDQYVRSLYWTITTMTTVGFGDITPARTVEYVVAMVVMLMGASLYAFVIGSIASLLSGLNAERTRYRDRMLSVTHYLQQQGVSPDLHQRVRRFYEYLWGKHRGVAENELFQDLPRSLQIDIKTQVAANILRHVPLFEFCTPALRDELLAALQLETFDPGSVIVREGETGRHIYFVVDGTLQVIRSDRDEPYAELRAGEYFGYLSVVLKERRTASVVATGYCDLLRLSQGDYQAIMDAYPEFREVLSKAAANKTEKMAELVIEGVVL